MNEFSAKKNNKLLDRFKEEAGGLGISLTNETIGRFSLYLEELKAWNRKINIFRRKDDLEIITKDFLDSLTVCKHLPSKASVLDIGSGGGFPGIPIKISRPDLMVVLSEVREKKIFFLRNIVRKLNLENLRVMERGSEKEEKFDFIVSRAFGSMAKLVETGESFLKENGIVISMKGRQGEEELKAELLVIRRKGWSPCFVEHFKLPIFGHSRVLIGLKRNVSRET